MPALIHNGSTSCKVTGITIGPAWWTSLQEAILFIRRLLGEPTISNEKLAVVDRIFTTNYYSWVLHSPFCQLGSSAFMHISSLHSQNKPGS